MAGEPIISIAQMRALDQAAPACGAPTLTLMENAGAAVAREIMARFSPRKTAVLCGPGNNGGDGWVCARRLLEAGWPVWVETLLDRATLRGDAAVMAARFKGDVHGLRDDSPVADLFVDALFGAGLSRPLDGPAARMAAALQASPLRVVAVDVPSGLAGDEPAPLAGAAFRAGLTVTFAAMKRAHVLYPARAWCGDVVVDPIGMPEAAWAAVAPTLWRNGPELWGAAFPWPAAQAHKHARGHAMVVSGPAAQTGAARLAAMGALRAGAGLVTVLSPPGAVLVNAAHLTAIMLRSCADPAAFADAAKTAQAIVIGPAAGVVPATRITVEALACGPAALVLDADAITVFAGQSAALAGLVRPRDVVTPHKGEFERLFPGLLQASPSRIEAACEAARVLGCTVLLKGPDTVIAGPDGRACVNATGAPFLATAGSGDVLAGFIGALLAQGMSGFDAACAGAWLHGLCGQSCGPGLIAEDLPGALPGVLSTLMAR